MLLFFLFLFNCEWESEWGSEWVSEWVRHAFALALPNHQSSPSSAANQIYFFSVPLSTKLLNYQMVQQNYVDSAKSGIFKMWVKTGMVQRKEISVVYTPSRFLNVCPSVSCIAFHFLSPLCYLSSFTHLSSPTSSTLFVFTLIIINIFFHFARH